MSLTRTGLCASSLGLTSAAAISAAFGQEVAANVINNQTVETVTVTDQRLTLGLLPDKILDTPQSVECGPRPGDPGTRRHQPRRMRSRMCPASPSMPAKAAPMAIWSICAASRSATIIFWTGCATPASIPATRSITNSVEVLKGPSSTLFGRGTTGGAINQVTKSPELYPIDDFSVTGGTNAEARGTADVNYVLDDDVGGTRQFDGPAQQCRRPAFRAQSALGHRALHRLWPRHRHGVDAQISAPAGGRYSRHWRAVPVRPARAGAQECLLRPADRRPLQDRCRGRDRQGGAQVQRHVQRQRHRALWQLLV